jgi:hypothetical protein
MSHEISVSPYLARYTKNMDIKLKTDRQLLEDTYELARENNRILHAQRRDAFVGGIVKFIFWILIFLILPYYLYAFYLKPYLDQFVATYQGIEEKTAPLQNIDIPQGIDFGGLFEKLFPTKEGVVAE